MILPWGEGFLGKTMRFLFLVLAVLFCWGWVSHVILGRMTTGQYIRKISIDFQQGITNECKKISKTGNTVANNVRDWNGPATV